MTFGCHVTGDPEPQVSWLYDDRPINHTWLTIEAEEGLLDKWANISVYNVSDADAGVYTCVATNSLSTASSNVTLVLPEVVTATTLSKSEANTLRWMGLVAGAAVACILSCAAMVAMCMRGRGRRKRSNLKASVSFTDQEKKLLDVSIATTTDRGTGSCEAFGTEMELVDPPVHITIENDPLPMVSTFHSMTCFLQVVCYALLKPRGAGLSASLKGRKRTNFDPVGTPDGHVRPGRNSARGMQGGRQDGLVKEDAAEGRGIRCKSYWWSLCVLLQNVVVRRVRLLISR